MLQSKTDEIKKEENVRTDNNQVLNSEQQLKASGNSEIEIRSDHDYILSSNSRRKNKDCETQNHFSCCVNSNGVHCCVKHVTDELVSDLTEELDELDNMLEKTTQEKGLETTEKNNTAKCDHEYLRQDSDFKQSKDGVFEEVGVPPIDVHADEGKNGGAEEVGVLGNSKLVHLQETNSVRTLGVTHELERPHFTSSDKHHSISEDVEKNCILDVQNLVEKICQQVCVIGKNYDKFPNTAVDKRSENMKSSDRSDKNPVLEESLESKVDLDIIGNLVDKMCEKVCQCDSKSSLEVEDSNKYSKSNTIMQNCAFGNDISSERFLSNNCYLATVNLPISDSGLKSVTKEHCDQLTGTNVENCISGEKFTVKSHVAIGNQPTQICDVANEPASFKLNEDNANMGGSDGLVENDDLPLAQTCHITVESSTESIEKECGGRSSTFTKNSLCFSEVEDVFRECGKSHTLPTQDCNTGIPTRKNTINKMNKNTCVQNCETGSKDSVDKCTKNNNGTTNNMKVGSNTLEQEHKTLFVEKIFDSTRSHIPKELLTRSNLEKLEVQPFFNPITVPQLPLKRSVSFSDAKSEISIAKNRSKRLRMSLENFPVMLKNVTKVNIVSRDENMMKNPVGIKKKMNEKLPQINGSKLLNSGQEDRNSGISLAENNNCIKKEELKVICDKCGKRGEPGEDETANFGSIGKEDSKLINDEHGKRGELNEAETTISNKGNDELKNAETLPGLDSFKKSGISLAENNNCIKKEELKVICDKRGKRGEPGEDETANFSSIGKEDSKLINDEHGKRGELNEAETTISNKGNDELKNAETLPGLDSNLGVDSFKKKNLDEDGSRKMLQQNDLRNALYGNQKTVGNPEKLSTGNESCKVIRGEPSEAEITNSINVSRPVHDDLKKPETLYGLDLDLGLDSFRKENLDEDSSVKTLQRNDNNSSEKNLENSKKLSNDSREEISNQNDLVKPCEISSEENFLSEQKSCTKTIEKNVSTASKRPSSQRCKVIVPRIDPQRLDNLKKNHSTTSGSKSFTRDAFDEIDTASLMDADYLDTMPISKLKSLLSSIKNRCLMNETEILNNVECESPNFSDIFAGNTDAATSSAVSHCLTGANLTTSSAKTPDKSAESPENSSKSKRKSKPVKLNFNDSKKRKTFLTHKRLRKIPGKLLDKFIIAHKINRNGELKIDAGTCDVTMRNAGSCKVTMQNADLSDITVPDVPDTELQNSDSATIPASTISKQVSCSKMNSIPDVTLETEKKDSLALSKTKDVPMNASRKKKFSRNGVILKPHSSEANHFKNVVSTPKGSHIRRDLRVSISPIEYVSKSEKILVGNQKKNSVPLKRKNEFGRLKNSSKSLVIEAPIGGRSKRCGRRSLNAKPSSGESEPFQNTRRRSFDLRDEKLRVLTPFHYNPKLSNIKMTFEPGVMTCCFCHLPANHLLGLGDLFGPYRPLAEEVLERHETVNEHLKLNPTVVMRDPAHSASGSPQVTINTEKSTCFLTARIEEDQTNVDGSTVKDISKAVERSSHRLRTLSTIEHVLQNTNNVVWQRKQKLIPNIKKNTTLRIPGPKDECDLIPRREFNPTTEKDSQRPQNESVVPNINSIVFLEPNINMPHVGSSMGSPQLRSGHSSPQDVTPESSSRRLNDGRVKMSPRSRNNHETSEEANSDSTCVCISHGFSTTPLWVHGNCAIWADGVYAIRGQIYGLWDAARMSNQITCHFCNRPGATIASKQDSINSKVNNVPLKAYHYPCSIAAELKLNWENLTAQN